MKKTSQKEVKGQQGLNEECHKDIDAADVTTSGATSNNGSACLYKTQGTIASIDLMDKSFTIDPISPYVFEQGKGDSAEKFILFVSGEDSKSNRKANVQIRNRVFKIPEEKGVDIGVIIALKNGREKIELKVKSLSGKNALEVESIEITKA